jgi:hypothetical protein
MKYWFLRLLIAWAPPLSLWWVKYIFKKNPLKIYRNMPKTNLTTPTFLGYH